MFEFRNLHNSVDPYVLELGEVDSVLGITWIETLGEVIMDWIRKVMKFQCADKTILVRDTLNVNENKKSLFSLLDEKQSRRG